MTVRPWLQAVLSCVALVVAYFVVPLNAAASVGELGVRVAIALVGIGVAGWLTVRQIGHQVHRPDAPLFGLFMAMVAAVLLFAVMDYVIAAADPGQFVGLNTRVDALYFALTTLATVGFGDVHAEGQLARGVVCLQLVFNVVVLATGASVLLRQLGVRARSR